MTTVVQTKTACDLTTRFASVCPDNHHNSNPCGLVGRPYNNGTEWRHDSRNYLAHCLLYRETLNPMFVFVFVGPLFKFSANAPACSITAVRPWSADRKQRPCLPAPDYRGQQRQTRQRQTNQTGRTQYRTGNASQPATCGATPKLHERQKPWL